MDNQIYPQQGVPAGPLLPPNDPNPMAAYYGGNDPFADAKSPVEDPNVMRDMHTAINQAIKPTVMPEPETDVVNLPVPALIAGEWVTTAQVRELNGGDEEEIIRARVSDQPERILDALLQAGVVKLGNVTPNAADLLDLAIANRDELMLAIRKVTYGPELRFEELRCTSCGQRLYVNYDLNEVPRGESVSPGQEWRTKANLRKGGYALLRLPSGADQVAILGEIREKDINRAEQDTLLIARCLEKIVTSDGTEIPNGGVAQARALSLADRAAITKAMDENRPGPHTEAAKITCPECRTETEVPLSVDFLFRG